MRRAGLPHFQRKSLARFVARQPVRPQVRLPPDALYDVLVHAEVAARRRHDQYVVPSGGGRRVAASTRARSRTVNFHRGRPR